MVVGLEATRADVERWDAWRPEDVAALFDGVHTPWYVAAGWAIDLFLGEERREHEDLEVAVPRHRFGEIAAVRPKDEDDFAAVLPRLEPSQRQWLADALRLVHPGHAWVEKLA